MGVMNLMFALLVTHYRIPHFHAMHRAMHPWKTTSIPDLGKFPLQTGARSAPQVLQPDSLLRDEHAPCRGDPLLLCCSHPCCPRPPPCARVGSDHRLCDGSLAWA